MATRAEAGVLTHGSLFTGIGGFDLGFEWAGIKALWQVELDEYCCKVLAKHWPEVERFKDIKDCGKHNLRAVDIISGGFPCQPVSIAGFRKGASDHRWLWDEMFRVVEEIDPTYVVGENVPGIIELELDRVLSDLEGIGYEATSFDIPACSMGLPTMERHVWIVATSSIFRCQRSKTTPDKDNRDEGQFQGTDQRRYNRWNISQTRFRRVCERVSRKLGPNQRNRLKGLGNAIVPQIAEIIGRMIIQAERLRI